MAGIDGTLIGSILALVLGGGTIAGVLQFITTRKTQKVDYSAAVHKTLSEFNSSLTEDVRELRAELDKERERRIKVEEELADERRLRRDLEQRVARLERDTGPQPTIRKDERGS